jgi:hypothetical protein
VRKVTVTGECRVGFAGTSGGRTLEYGAGVLSKDRRAGDARREERRRVSRENRRKGRAQCA